MAGVEKVRLPAPESRPALALGVAVGLDLLLMLLLFIPFFGYVLALTVVPYLGGRLGGRYAHRRAAVWMGAVAGMVLMVIISILVLWALGRTFPGADLELAEPIGLSFLAIGFALTVLFGALGGSHGGKQPKKTAKD